MQSESEEEVRGAMARGGERERTGKGVRDRTTAHTKASHWSQRTKGLLRRLKTGQQ